MPEFSPSSAPQLFLPKAERFFPQMPDHEDLLALQSQALDRIESYFLHHPFFSNSVVDNAHLSSTLELCGFVQALAKSPLLFPAREERRTFFDLGCGSGKMQTALAALGWRSLGVDLRQECVTESKLNFQNAEEAGYIPPELCKVAVSSFFPMGFIPQRSSIPRFDPRSDYLVEISSGVPSLDQTPSVLGFAPNEADLFFHYQVERLQNIIDLFALVAKPGAVLAVAITFWEDSNPLLPASVDFVGMERCGGQTDNPVVVFAKNHQ